MTLNETRLKTVRKRHRKPKREYVFIYEDEGCLYTDYGYPNEHQLTKAEVDALKADETKTIIIMAYDEIVMEG